MTETSRDLIIGEMLGQMKSIIAAQDAAAASRKATYEKLEAMDKKLDATDAKVCSIDERLEKVEKTAADIDKWRERSIGAWMLIVGVSAIAGGALVTFGKKLWAVLIGP